MALRYCVRLVHEKFWACSICDCCFQVAGFCLNQIKFADTNPELSADNDIPGTSNKKWDDITRQEMDAFKNFWIDCSKSDILVKNG